MKTLRRAFETLKSFSADGAEPGERTRPAGLYPGQKKSMSTSACSEVDGSYISFDDQSLSIESSVVSYIDPLGSIDSSFSKLHKWAFLGNLTKLKKFIKKVDINAEDGEGRTALHLCAYSGHTDVLLFLLSENANPEKRDRDGRTPIFRATERGHITIVQILLQYKVDVLVRDNMNNTLLHISAQSGSKDITELFLSRGLGSEEMNTHGRTPFHLAATNLHIDLIRLFLSHGVDVNKGDKEGVTPLMMAARKGCRPLVDVLCRSGADILKRDSSGWDASLYAKFSGYTELHQTLIRETNNSSLLQVSETSAAMLGLGRDLSPKCKADNFDNILLDSENSWNDDSSDDEKKKVDMQRFMIMYNDSNSPTDETSSRERTGLQILKEDITDEADEGALWLNEQIDSTKIVSNAGGIALLSKSYENLPLCENHEAERDSNLLLCENQEAERDSNLLLCENQEAERDSNLLLCENQEAERDSNLLLCENQEAERDPNLPLCENIEAERDPNCVDIKVMSPLSNENSSTSESFSNILDSESLPFENYRKCESSRMKEVFGNCVKNESVGKEKVSDCSEKSGTLGRLGTLHQVDEMWEANAKVHADRNVDENSEESSPCGNAKVHADRNVDENSEESSPCGNAKVHADRNVDENSKESSPSIRKVLFGNSGENDFSPPQGTTIVSVHKDCPVKDDRKLLSEKDTPHETNEGFIDKYFPMEDNNSLQDKDPLPLEDNNSLQDKDPFPLEDDNSLQDKDPLPLEDDSSLQDKDPLPLEDDNSLQDKDSLPLEYDKSLQDKDPFPLEDDNSLQDKDPLPLEDNNSLQDKDPIPLEDDNSLQDKDSLPLEDDNSLQDKDPLPLDDDLGCLSDKDTGMEASNCLPVKDERCPLLPHLEMESIYSEADNSLIKRYTNICTLDLPNDEMELISQNMRILLNRECTKTAAFSDMISQLRSNEELLSTQLKESVEQLSGARKTISQLESQLVKADYENASALYQARHLSLSLEEALKRSDVAEKDRESLSLEILAKDTKMMMEGMKNRSMRKTNRSCQTESEAKQNSTNNCGVQMIIASSSRGSQTDVEKQLCIRNASTLDHLMTESSTQTDPTIGVVPLDGIETVQPQISDCACQTLFNLNMEPFNADDEDKPFVGVSESKLKSLLSESFANQSTASERTSLKDINENVGETNASLSELVDFCRNNFSNLESDLKQIATQLSFGDPMNQNIIESMEKLTANLEIVSNASQELVSFGDKLKQTTELFFATVEKSLIENEMTHSKNRIAFTDDFAKTVTDQFCAMQNYLTIFAENVSNKVNGFHEAKSEDNYKLSEQLALFRVALENLKATFIDGTLKTSLFDPGVIEAIRGGNEQAISSLQSQSSIILKLVDSCRCSLERLAAGQADNDLNKEIRYVKALEQLREEMDSSSRESKLEALEAKWTHLEKFMTSYLDLDKKASLLDEKTQALFCMEKDNNLLITQEDDSKPESSLDVNIPPEQIYNNLGLRTRMIKSENLSPNLDCGGSNEAFELKEKKYLDDIQKLSNQNERILSLQETLLGGSEQSGRNDRLQVEDTSWESVKSLKLEKRSLEGNVRSLEGNVRSLEGNVRELMGEISRLESDREELRSELLMKNSQIINLKKDSGKQQRVIRDLRQQLEGRANDAEAILELQQRISDLEKEISGKHSLILNLRERMSGLAQEKHDLMNQLTLNAALSVESKSILDKEDAERDFKLLRNQLEEVKRSIEERYVPKTKLDSLYTEVEAYFEKLLAEKEKRLNAVVSEKLFFQERRCERLKQSELELKRRIDILNNEINSLKSKYSETSHECQVWRSKFNKLFEEHNNISTRNSLKVPPKRRVEEHPPSVEEPPPSGTAQYQNLLKEIDRLLKRPFENSAFLETSLGSFETCKFPRQAF